MKSPRSIDGNLLNFVVITYALAFVWTPTKNEWNVGSSITRNLFTHVLTI